MIWKSWLPTSVIRAKVVTVMKSRSSVLYPFDIENSITFTPEFWSTIWVLCASLVAQMVKNLPTLQEIWVQSLGWEDPLEKGMPTHSSILTWKIPWTEEPGRLQSRGRRVRHWHQLLCRSSIDISLNDLNFLLHRKKNGHVRSPESWREPVWCKITRTNI